MQSECGLNDSQYTLLKLRDTIELFQELQKQILLPASTLARHILLPKPLCEPFLSICHDVARLMDGLDHTPHICETVLEKSSMHGYYLEHMLVQILGNSNSVLLPRTHMRLYVTL